MKDDFSKLLDLLEKVANIDNQESLEHLEKEIQLTSYKITDAIKDSSGSQPDFSSLDLQKLEELVNKISNKHLGQKQFLSDFQMFLKNRKIN